MFERLHHRRIARVLEALDGERLRARRCWFGGGTAITLRYGEFRESVDIDFLVADPDGYRQLRQEIAVPGNLDAMMRDGASSVALVRDVRSDQYGIRTAVDVDGLRIKFEIVREARIALEPPGRRDVVCGIATLTTTDLAVSKLLANADRWRDDSAFSRDAIDLAMMDLPPRHLRPAVDKAVQAYGDSAVSDMMRALGSLQQRPGHLQRCIDALSISMPAAALHQRLRALRRRLQVYPGRDGAES
ncbi:nucleotidyl transferase AbiEii/AbiGii toxin family protein [Sinimarinibacterium flocculans]|uniref:nucleotidyl transferase AbiEii/AbiGii toxin family protein n=1 Tax=Sinimarinibacterium flocculans TaxID=985250 RepID=UPI0035129E36